MEHLASLSIGLASLPGKGPAVVFINCAMVHAASLACAACSLAGARVASKWNGAVLS